MRALSISWPRCVWKENESVLHQDYSHGWIRKLSAGIFGLTLEIAVSWLDYVRFITGKLSVLCDLFSSLLKPCFYVKISLFKTLSCNDFVHTKQQIVLFISMFFYIISVNTFQIRPRKTEFQKPFGLLIYSNRGYAWKITPTRADKSPRKLIILSDLRVDSARLRQGL